MKYIKRNASMDGMNYLKRIQRQLGIILICLTFAQGGGELAIKQEEGKIFVRALNINNWKKNSGCKK